MTRSEYQELIQFLGQKFDRIDERFSLIDERFSRIDGRFDSVEGRLAKVEVGNEQNAHQIQVLAEGITAVDQKLERFREEMAEEFRLVRAEMADGSRLVRADMAENSRLVRADMAKESTSVRGEMAAGFREQGERLDLLVARMDGWEGRKPRPRRI